MSVLNELVWVPHSSKFQFISTQVFYRLNCNLCAKPFENYDFVEWHYKPLTKESNATEMEPLDLMPQMEYTNNKTLKIFNVIEGFSGLYTCFYGKNPVSIYILEISKNDTIQKVKF